MNPKSHKDFKEGIADEVGVHPSVVEDFITFYYGKLRKNKLEKSIKKNKSVLGNLAKRTYVGFAKSEEIQKNVTMMENALKQMEQDILNKKKFRNEK